MSEEIKQLFMGPGGAQAPFMGKHAHKLDPKKRLTIPSAWRKLFVEEDGVFLMPGVGRPCLTLMSKAEMAKTMEKLQGMMLSNPEQMDLMLTVASESDHLSFDVQGRIRIKDEHLALAELSGEVMLAGAFNRVEVWNMENFANRGAGANTFSSAIGALNI